MNPHDPQAFPNESAAGLQGTEPRMQSGASPTALPSPPSAEKLKEQAIQTRDEVTQAVKTRAASYFDQQKGQVAGLLHDVSIVTRHCVQEMEQQRHPRLGQAVDGIANRMDELCDTLQQKDLNYFVDRAQDVARRQPGLFVGGALALGFLVVRFFKSARPAAGSQPAASRAPEPQSEGLHQDSPSGGAQFTI